ncbi:hypothetical protein QUW58_11250 [Enterocloster aldenensis]|uniref:DUF7716 domain-containing protein n=1 Tax=Enterocloster aldenensis TaxID=358742 RepID=UPI0025A36335|nr:hypothetical protein [Enterocloster aldenensis]
MNKYVTLGDVLKNFKDFKSSEELFLLDEEMWGEDTKGMLLDLEGLKDETEVMKNVKEKQNMVHTDLGISDIKDIVDNAYLQKENCSLNELIKAFIFYYNNDAFINFEENI